MLAVDQTPPVVAFAKAVVYSVSDTATALAGATAGARNEAVNITASGTAIDAEVTTLWAATNTGTTTIAAARVTAAQAVAYTYDATGDDTITAGAGNDFIIGGLGADIFVIDPASLIGAGIYALNAKTTATPAELQASIIYV